jgi:hypothetical protein
LHVVVSSTCCVVFTLCWQFLWIVHFWLPLRSSLTFIYYTQYSQRHSVINQW